MSNLDDVIDVLENVHRYEEYVSAICPFHDDSRPSLIVHDDTYRCLSCGAFGRTESLLNRTPVIKTNERVFYNPWTDWLHRDTYIEKILIRNWQFLIKNPYFASYLHKRGLPNTTLQNFGVGWRENWFTFPIRNEKNAVIGAVARAGEDNDSPSKYVVPSGQNPNLLYIPSIKLLEKTDIIYVTFGILDSLSLAFLGIPSMSTTNGKRISTAALLAHKKQIVIIPDRGEESEALQIAATLSWRGKAARLPYPEGCKDISDVLQHCGPDYTRNMILGV